MTSAADDTTTARPAWLRAVPLVVVLAVVATGLILISLDRWRRGATSLGLGTALAGGLRLVLSPEAAGYLVVRSRTFDVLFAAVLTLGAAVLILEP